MVEGENNKQEIGDTDTLFGSSHMNEISVSQGLVEKISPSNFWDRDLSVLSRFVPERKSSERERDFVSSSFLPPDSSGSSTLCFNLKIDRMSSIFDPHSSATGFFFRFSPQAVPHTFFMLPSYKSMQ